MTTSRCPTIALLVFSLGFSMGPTPGCSGEGNELGEMPSAGPTSMYSGMTSGRCEAGASRSCSITLGETSGILSCFHGNQTCIDGDWGPCGDGTTVEQLRLPAPSGLGGPRPLALSAPGPCEQNPCDPSCRDFEEEPTTPLSSITSVAPPDWTTGTLGDIPSSFLDEAFREPCQTARDCQYNSRCEAPDAGACFHSTCATGAPLEASCNDCAAMVCAVDDSCCAEPPAAPSCTHDPCERGAPLKATCHPCVAQICQDMPSCCDAAGFWTGACAAAVETSCGATCGCGPGEVAQDGRCYFQSTSEKSWQDARAACAARGGTWDLAAVSDQTEQDFLASLSRSGDVWIGFTSRIPYSSWGRWVWSSGSPSGYWRTDHTGELFESWASTSSTGRCAVMRASDAAWEPAYCGESHPSLCEGPPSRLTDGQSRRWSSDCVARADALCAVQCDASDPSNTTGSCVPWYPGEVDATCFGPDLAVGVPCEGTIPVCNHGTMTAPAGVRLVHFPSGSGQFGETDPDVSGATECTTTETILPGRCIEVADCPGLASGREIMVNPGGAVSECSTLDNWAIHHDGACEEPVCAGGSTTTTAATSPVDIIFLIDNSKSMDLEIAEVQTRIYADFAQIIEQSGLDYRVIMISRYGQVGVAIGDSNHPICIGSPLGGNACTNPSTEPLKNNPPKFFHYSADVGSRDAFCLSIASFDQPDEFGDPNRSGWSVKAPNGWSAWLREEAFKTFVFIGDDDVSCSSWGYAFDDLSTTSGGAAAAAAFDAQLTARSPEQFGTPSARNYVWHSIVGVPDAAVPNEAWPSTAPIQTSMCSTAAGPGIGYQALSKLTGGLRYPVCRAGNFDAVFSAIAHEVIATAQAQCDFTLPQDTNLDPESAQVHYDDGSGAETMLSEVASLAACSGDGWYYDDPTNPSQLSLCPSSCNSLQSTAGARAWMEVGCQLSTAGSYVTTEVYEATCAPDQSPVWTFFGYDTSVPADARVSFRMRAAGSEAALSSEAWTDIATATRTPDTQVCELEEGVCPIDLYGLLGQSAVKLPFLELEITLQPNPSGQTPNLNDWRISYSCPFSQ